MNAWGRLVATFSHREPATPLALFRFVVGLITVWLLAELAWSGVAAAIWLPPEQGGMLPPNDTHWLWRVVGPPTETLWPVLGLAFAGAILTTIGLGSRLGALITVQCLLALLALRPNANGGADRVLTNALWLVVLSPADATLSLRCWLRHRRWTDDTPQPAWPRYLVIYQLALIYCSTGIQKLGADWWPWGDFRAVYYSLLLPTWQRWEHLAWVAWLYPLTQVGTVVTLIFEITWFVVPLALVYRATRTRPGRLRAAFNRWDVRTIYVLIGAGMHLGIWVTMNVGAFSAITTAGYLCLFHHDEYGALWKGYLHNDPD